MERKKKLYKKKIVYVSVKSVIKVTDLKEGHQKAKYVSLNLSVLGLIF